MAKLVAGRTVSFGQLGFLTSVYQAGRLFNYDFISVSPTKIRIYDSAKSDIVFTGSGFTGSLSAGFTGGTINSITLRFDSKIQFTVTDIKQSAKKFFDFAKANATEVLWKIGMSGNDTIIGTAFDDSLIGYAGADVIRGGNGIDTVSYATSTKGVTVNLAKATGQVSGGDAKGDRLTSIENLTGSSKADTLIGNGKANKLLGNEGSDKLTGGAGDDELRGDEFSFGATGGNDTLIGGTGDDKLEGADGNDVLYGGAGADQLLGYDGIDTVSYSSSKGVKVALDSSLATGETAGEAVGDVFNGIEILIGSKTGADTLIGNERTNTIIGQGGNDTIRGRAGGDQLNGGAGADTLDGEAGSDYALYSSSKAKVTVDLGNSGKQVSGGEASGDTLISIENVLGSKFADKLTGTEDSNTFVGGAGADTINGKGGNDTASYGSSSKAVQVNLALATKQVSTGDASGDVLSNIENVSGSRYGDTLIGTDSKNTFVGGKGNDTLTGGAEADSFIFAEGFGKDTITDFAGGIGAGDLIRLSYGLIVFKFDQVKAKAIQDGEDTVITFDSKTVLTLEKVQLATLAADDFSYF